MLREHCEDQDLENTQAGLSLVEVMVVVVIIGLLATIITINVLPMLGDANSSTARTQVSQLEQALETYRLRMGRYPSTDEGLQALVTPPADPRLASRYPEGGFINALPEDPWGNAFLYLYPGENGRFDVWTLGADGREGGSGEDADIGNWTPEQP